MQYSLFLTRFIFLCTVDQENIVWSYFEWRQIICKNLKYFSTKILNIFPIELYLPSSIRTVIELCSPQIVVKNNLSLLYQTGTILQSLLLSNYDTEWYKSKNFIRRPHKIWPILEICMLKQCWRLAMLKKYHSSNSLLGRSVGCGLPVKSCSV